MHPHLSQWPQGGIQLLCGEGVPRILGLPQLQCSDLGQPLRVQMGAQRRGAL